MEWVYKLQYLSLLTKIQVLHTLIKEFAGYLLYMYLIEVIFFCVDIEHQEVGTPRQCNCQYLWNIYAHL